MMKKKLFDMFAELFGDSEGARFYFSPGRVNLIVNTQIITVDMYFHVH